MDRDILKYRKFGILRNLAQKVRDYFYIVGLCCEPRCIKYVAVKPLRFKKNVRDTPRSAEARVHDRHCVTAAPTRRRLARRARPGRH